MAYKFPPPTPRNSVMATRAADGERVRVYKPRTREEVYAQAGIPAWFLAVLAFASDASGHLRWSEFTSDTLRRLARQYGDDPIRNCLAVLLEEMREGLEPVNPIGLLIHRIRATATQEQAVL